MQLFYAPDIVIGNKVLNDIESRHCVQVLRHKKGDVITIIDGEGGLYKAQISEANPKRCAFEMFFESMKSAKNRERFFTFVSIIGIVYSGSIGMITLNRLEKYSKTPLKLLRAPKRP